MKKYPAQTKYITIAPTGMMTGRVFLSATCPKRSNYTVCVWGDYTYGTDTVVYLESVVDSHVEAVKLFNLIVDDMTIEELCGLGLKIKILKYPLSTLDTSLGVVV